MTAVLDWAVRREDRRALLDTILAELESNLAALDTNIETADDQWQRAAASRWIDPELRRVVQRAYRMTGDYNQRLRLRSQSLSEQERQDFVGHRRNQAMIEARDTARPWVKYAAACVGSINAGKPMPLRPSDLKL